MRQQFIRVSAELAFSPPGTIYEYDLSLQMVFAMVEAMKRLKENSGIHRYYGAYLDDIETGWALCE
jgi:hypothetical protein